MVALVASYAPAWVAMAKPPVLPPKPNHGAGAKAAAPIGRATPAPVGRSVQVVGVGFVVIVVLGVGRAAGLASRQRQLQHVPPAGVNPVSEIP